MDSDAWLVTVLVSVLWPLGALVLLAFAGPGAYWAMVATGAAVAALFAGAPAAFGPAAVGIYLYVINRRNRRAWLAGAEAIVQQHAHELAIRRRQLVRVGAYGVVDLSDWDREADHFIAAVVEPGAGARRPVGDVSSELRAMIEAAVAKVPAATPFRADLDPIEYEAMVADTLVRHGWDARLTKASGDQGVDVLATKGALRVVLQCKLYSRPVGNAAVQEAIAGQRFEQATHAAVVSNQPFTRAAQQLAGAAGVLLLHHEELPDLERHCGAVAAISGA